VGVACLDGFRDLCQPVKNKFFDRLKTTLLFQKCRLLCFVGEICQKETFRFVQSDKTQQKLWIVIDKYAIKY